MERSGAGHVLDAQLAASTSAMWLPVEAAAGSAWADECRRLGAALDVVEEGGARALRVSVSHADADAFALFFLASQLAGVDGAAAARGRRRWTLAGMPSEHAWHRAAPARDDATPTQRLIRRLAPVWAAHGVSHVSLVVARSSAATLTPATYAGNGFLPVDFELAALRALAGGTRAEWKQGLAARTARIERLATRGPALLTRSRAQLMLSSAGDVGRLAWCAETVRPDRVQAVASPWRPETFNLFTWSRGDWHALALCGAPTHPLAAASAQLIAAWEAADDR